MAPASLPWDVAAVGGGPAGAVCAALLARLGFNVVLIAHLRERPRWSELLSPAATLALERLGAAAALASAGGTPCTGIVDAWNGAAAEHRNFPLTQCSVGWTVDRARLDAALQRFAAHEGAHVLRSRGPARLVSSVDDSNVELEAGGRLRRVRTSFLVDATGAASTLLPPTYRRRLRFDRLVAIRVPLARGVVREATMAIASSSAGWWYSLPICDQALEAVYLTDGDLLPGNRQAQLEHLHVQFLEAFATPLELCSHQAGARRLEIRDARTTCRTTLWRKQWLPIGDAAYSVDPITGSGLDRSLAMAEAAATCVGEYLQSGRSAAIEEFALANAARFSQSLSRLRSLYATRRGNPREASHPFWRRRGLAASFQKAI